MSLGAWARLNDLFLINKTHRGSDSMGLLNLYCHRLEREAGPEFRVSAFLDSRTMIL